MPRVRTVSALLAAALLGCESGPQRVGTAAPRPERGGLIKVVTFNLFNRPWQREGRLRTQLETLKELDADVVALQEVATGLLLRDEPAGLFARELDLAGVRFWHEQNLGAFRTGLGLLAKFPLREVAYADFEKNPFWDTKGYLTAKVETPRGPLFVVNVHLASTADARIRESEFEELGRHAARLALQAPVLLLGDFNSGPDAPIFARFAAALHADSLYAHLAAVHPTWNDSLELDCGDARGELLDHVLAIPGPSSVLRFRGGRIVVSPRAPHPSDHCPVTAELEIEPR